VQMHRSNRPSSQIVTLDFHLDVHVPILYCFAFMLLAFCFSCEFLVLHIGEAVHGSCPIHERIYSKFQPYLRAERKYCSYVPVGGGVQIWGTS